MTPLVTLDVWRVPPRRLPAALRRVAVDRFAVRSAPGARFVKVLGTGDGRTFAVRDATPLRWALLVVWDAPADADRFACSPVARGWAALAEEACRLWLTPLRSRGRWSGREPFGTPAGDHDGPVAALTRARLRPVKALAFRRAVPAVAAEARDAAGLRLAFGVGEAPVGLQGTFSVWDSAAALDAFAYRRPAHVDAVRRTPVERWYAEELFARFAVARATGTVDGVRPLP